MTLQEKRTMMLSLIDRWKESGKSQVGFVRIHQVNLAKFRYWVAEQRKRQPDMQSFIDLNSFCGQGIGIRYPNGVELSLPAQTSVVALQSLNNF